MENKSANDMKETMLDWLKDAHAMEQQSLKMFDDLSERLSTSYPELKAHVDQHRKNTQDQQSLLEQCLERHGGKPSILKDIAAKITAFSQSISGMPLDDEVVKASLSAYTFLHMKIASYSILGTAARALDDGATLDVCNKIMSQEGDMAGWLGERIPDITRKFIAYSADDNVS